MSPIIAPSIISASHPVTTYLKIFFRILNISNEVLLYTLLYTNFLGLRTQPYPLGILSPALCTTCLLMLVLALILLLRLGFLIPIFILPPLQSLSLTSLEFLYRLKSKDCNQIKLSTGSMAPDRRLTPHRNCGSLELEYLICSFLAS